MTVTRWHSVGDEDDNAVNVLPLLIVITEHLQSCYLETACRVCVLAEIWSSLNAGQHFGFRGVVV